MNSLRSSFWKGFLWVVLAVLIPLAAGVGLGLLLNFIGAPPARQEKPLHPRKVMMAMPKPNAIFESRRELEMMDVPLMCSGLKGSEWVYQEGDVMCKRKDCKIVTQRRCVFARLILKERQP
jgi:hypothetical protein